VAKAKRSKTVLSREEKQQRVRVFVLEQWPAFAASLSQYQWPLETERWHELAFCLLHKVGQPRLEARSARALVDILSRMDLLRVQELAGWMTDAGELTHSEPDAVLAVRVLERGGLPEKAARAALTSICQAAAALQKQYGGKVQRYLRHYGEVMLQELPQHFAFTHLSPDDAALVFTHWLQNVANMPLPLKEPPMERLCEEFGVSLEELIEAADEDDVNLALLDDMVASATAGAA
jgi:hypothetical protein